jgi:hypothetical protein
MKELVSCSMGILALATLMVGCDDDPTGTHGTVARVTLSDSLVELDVGDKASLWAEALDDQGNALSTPPEVISENTAVADVTVEPGASANPSPGLSVMVTAEGYGTTRVIASAGEVADTAVVMTFPASLEITGAGDTLASASTAQLTAQCFDTDGEPVAPLEGAQPVSWSSNNFQVAEVDATGLVYAKAPGRAVIAIALQNGASDGATLDVVPAEFGGTASASAGPSGTVVTYTVGAGQPSWDGNTEVIVGHLRNFIMSGSDDTNLTTAIPFGLEAGPARVRFLGLGPDRLALETTFDISALATQDDLEPNNRFDGTPPTPVSLPFEDVLAVDFVDQDDFFALTLTQDTTVIRLFLEWDGVLNADLDLLVADAAFTGFQCQAVTAGIANPEMGTCRLPAGDYLLWVDNFDASRSGNPNITNYHILVEAQ